MSIEYFVEGKIKTQIKGNYLAFSKENIVHNTACSVEQQGKETGVKYQDAKKLNPNDTPSNLIDVSLNLFFDGTQNNKTNTEAGKDYAESNHEDDSYTNDYSNVARGYDALDPKAENQVAEYIEGIGTEDLKSESLPFTTLPNNIGIPFGMGNRGVEAKVTKGCIKGAKALSIYAGQKGIRLKVNVYGFSRGATAARHFLHIATKTARMSYTQGGQKIQISPPYDGGRSEEIYLFTDKDGSINTFLSRYGYFGACLLHNDVNPVEIAFNFVGLYDTVASFGPVHSNDTIDLGLDAVNKAHFVLQLAADDEFRDNFDLTDIDSAGVKGLTFTLPGVHSDIGGCYVEMAEETSDLYKEEGSGKECEKFRNILISEGWYNDKPEEIWIERLSPHIHGSDARFLLKGRRKLHNTYDKIPLNSMFHYSKQFGVKYLEDIINDNHKIQEFFLIKINSQLTGYMNACNEVRNTYIQEYNKNNTSGDYIDKLKRISYLDYIRPEDLKKLRHQYLHWSASVTKTGLGPRVGFVTDARNRKRKIQYG
ncbi:Uncharacterized alpha/beta hydrolase domain [Chryseobacterium taichungense]|uniref:Uncharacterized alpha/beta hydrolase domain n=1 Tax=Chryseobacterium taichungense TaxID=295069 RepID=A0A1H8D256_9FLAO|nr:DUF2235 domain-containing protein [Chryseobacterium taichungense]SEN01511.1 Uncharacterized alpha/beta hydrolase domain [Chryseobacterium taichungense]